MAKGNVRSSANAEVLEIRQMAKRVNERMRQIEKTAQRYGISTGKAYSDAVDYLTEENRRSFSESTSLISKMTRAERADLKSTLGAFLGDPSASVAYQKKTQGVWDSRTEKRERERFARQKEMGVAGDWESYVKKRNAEYKRYETYKTLGYKGTFGEFSRTSKHLWNLYKEKQLSSDTIADAITSGDWSGLADEINALEKEQRSISAKAVLRLAKQRAIRKGI